MLVKLPVGEGEKHTVMVDYDMFASKVFIYLDDELQKTFILTGNPIKVEFSVGNAEKHNVSIHVRGKTIPVVTIYVDGNLIGTFR
ncbi:MAG: hypothetical protein RMH77_01320 [Sulfolobales archaeon]|nr:hypothetical protein [Sulfolobales archaeon]MCX8186236.1 hypothetical protein [Sulfolobales archaeon]MDW7969028.1 hypothetical protein [Sulfolobales archaeon]